MTSSFFSAKKKQFTFSKAIKSQRVSRIIKSFPGAESYDLPQEMSLRGSKIKIQKKKHQPKPQPPQFHCACRLHSKKHTIWVLYPTMSLKKLYTNFDELSAGQVHHEQNDSRQGGRRHEDINIWWNPGADFYSVTTVSGRQTLSFQFSCSMGHYPVMATIFTWILWETKIEIYII